MIFNIYLHISRRLATAQSFKKRWTLSTEQLTLGHSYHWSVATNKESDLVARDGRSGIQLMAVPTAQLSYQL